IAQADVVVALGSRLGPFGTLPQHGMDYWPKEAKIIQIDADNKMLGLVKKISVGICGDAKAAAVALLERLQDKKLASDATKEARAKTIADEKAAWEKDRKSTRLNSSHVKISYAVFCLKKKKK